MIVVFGGGGFVGCNVAEFYSARGEQVRVVDDDSRAALLNAGDRTLSNLGWVRQLPGVEVIDRSILDADLLPDVVRGADAVVHAAAQTAVTVSIDDPRTDFMINALGTFNVLEAVRLASPEASLVFCSTNKVYGENVNRLPVAEGKTRYMLEGDMAMGIPESLTIDLCEHSPYGASKTAADIYVQEYGHLYGLRTSVFRMSCIYGPRQWGVTDQGWLAWFAKAILTGSPITIYGDGRQTRDLLFVSDLVDAMDRALGSEKGGEVFNIGGGPQNTSSLLEAIKFLEDVTGKEARIEYSSWRASDQRVYVSDIRKAHRVLGWEPLVAPDEGVKSLVSWLSTLPGATALGDAV